MSQSQDLSAVIGVELRGQGFDQVGGHLDRQLQGWERIEASVARIGMRLDSVIGKIGLLGGGVGIGAVVNQFMQADDSASRLALNAGSVGSYNPYRAAMAAAGNATSMPGAQLAAALAGLQGQVGTGGLVTPAQAGAFGTYLGNYSRSFGIDVGQLGAQAGNLLMFQRLGAGAYQGVLNQVAGQAAAVGQTAQTGQYLTSVAGVTGALGGMHPMMTGPGLSNRMGALYGAVGTVNPVFRDPGTFATGVMGLDSGLTSAYGNPRLQAALQMAGVGYWQQRGGLAGKGGVDMARKVLGYADRQYGKGSIEEDLFLRSNFGDVSADMLRAFSKGQVTYEDLLHHQQGPNIAGRSHANQQTPSARANRALNDATGKSGGILQWLSDNLQPDSLGGVLGLAGGLFLGRKLLGKGSSSLFKALMRRGGSKAAGAADAAAGDLLGDVGGGSLLGELLGIGSKAARVGGPAGAVAGFLLDPGNLTDDNKAMLHAWVAQLSKKFGPDWAGNPQAKAFAQKNLLPQFRGKADGALMHAFDLGAHATASANPIDKLGAAADKLSKAADKLLQNPDRYRIGPRTTSYGMDASGLQGSGDLLGGAMVMARFLTGGGGGGGGLAGTEMTAFGAGGGGGGGGGGAPAGGGWQSCTLTWYDPALGGINSGNGKPDPHHGMANGQPYSASAHTCAAPSSYAFGTQIEFALGKKTVTCTVTDRGGAITGSHFDLSRGAAQAIGLISAGRASGKFRVKSSGSAGAGSSGGNAVLASWQAGAGAAASSLAASYGGGSGVGVHVSIDGRKIEAQRRLIRG